MLKNILTIILFFIFISAQSQINEYFDDIKKTYEKDRQDDLIKISQKIKEAQILFSSGDLSKMEKASVIFQENYRKLFLTYEQKLDELSKESEGDIGDYIFYLLRESRNSFSISISDRVFAGKEKNDSIFSDLLETAHQYEIEAIDFQSRAFGVINGWIIENLTVPERNYGSEEKYDNSFTDNFIAKYFACDYASIPENYSFNRRIRKGKNNETSTVIVYSDKIDISDYNHRISVRSEYRIQIGASILPATESQTDRLNSTDLKVRTYKSNVYYKYTIGNFESFQEAKNFKNAYGLSKTFITEYKNGKQVNLFMRDFY